MGRSCCESARGRFEGTDNVASSSALGRFSGSLVEVVVGRALVVALERGAAADVAVSPRRAATLDTAFFLITGPSGGLTGASFALSFSLSTRASFALSFSRSALSFCLSAGTSFARSFPLSMRVSFALSFSLSAGASWLSFCSGFFLGGRRNRFLTVDIFAGAGFGDVPLIDTDRMRFSVLTGASGFGGFAGGTARLWVLRSDEDVDTSDSARLRCTSSLSSSAWILDGRVGERMSGRP